MKLLMPNIPSDFCESAFIEAKEIAEENGFDFDNIYILISNFDKIEDVEKIVGKTRVIQDVYVPRASWTIFDILERFIYYNHSDI